METLSKPRSDAWDADLTEAQRWQAYAQFRRSSWFEVSAWAAAQFGVDAPSRSALYRWAGRMREQESAHRIEQSIVAREEIGTLASTVASDSALIDAYKTLAADLALKGNASDAVKFTVMAMELGNGQRKAVELELKARAQQTKDEQLKLAREKFEAAEARLNKAKEVVGDAKLTDAERTAKMKEIFGL
jgi:hypothetical protein